MFFYTILFILGICFGSFSTVLISRWHSGQGGIALGRSECPHCKKNLTTWELFPVISWIAQLGKCRNCGTTISVYYPLSEIAMGLIFVIVGLISDRLGVNNISFTMLLLLFWSFTTLVYIIYDIRFMEIPDQMLIPAIMITLFGLLGGYIGYGNSVFFDSNTYPTFHTLILDHLTGALILYTFFFLQILIPGVHYLLRYRRLGDILSLSLSYITFPIITILDFFNPPKPEKVMNNAKIPTWIGGGDLRIAIFIGLTLGTLHSLSTLVFAYIFGSIVGIVILIYTKIEGREHSHEIPFGPFLGIGWFLSLYFYNDIIDYISLQNF